MRDDSNEAYPCPQCGNAYVMGANACPFCEIERLQAIVNRLPVTADGVPVVPGMKVYYGYRCPNVMQLIVQDFGQWTRAEGAVETFAAGSYDRRSQLQYVSDCYSTREAAETANEEK